MENTFRTSDLDLRGWSEAVRNEKKTFVRKERFRMLEKIKDFIAVLIIIISLYFATECAWGGYFLTIPPDGAWLDDALLRIEAKY